METITAKGHFHAAHRQLGYDGKCAYVHGHTLAVDGGWLAR